MSKGINFSTMSDEDLADDLYHWIGDASNAWDHFSEKEKQFFRRLENEACSRFVREHCTVEETDDGNL